MFLKIVMNSSLRLRSFFLLSGTLAVACLFLAQTRLQAQLQWEAVTIEETLALGQSESAAVFRFENKGRYPVVIRSTNSSCGCTTAALTRTTYYPGDKGEITARFEVGNRTGLRRNTIQVLTNDPMEPSTTLTYAVTIPTLVTIAPRLVHWRAGEAPEKKAVRIQLHPEADLKLKGVEVDDANLEAILREGDKPNEYIVELTPLQTNSPGRAIISLQTEPEVENRHNFSFYAYVR
jgi:hypothetical protein